MRQMDRDRVRELIEILKSSTAAEVSVREGDQFIRIRQSLSDTASPPEASALETEPEAIVVTSSTRAIGVPVCSKLVGIFYRGLEEGAPSLAEVGAQVAEGEIIGNIESVGRRTDVVSPVAGEIVEIVAQEAAPVQYGEVLMRIQPHEGSE